MRTSVLIAATAVLALAGCSSSTSKAAAAPPSSHAPANTAAKAPATKPSSATSDAACNLPSKGDVLVRYVTPGQPATAQQVGGVNLATCESTFDSLASTSPTDPGYCTQAALVADNPNYDPDAVPAPPLKKVQAKVGPACG